MSTAPKAKPRAIETKITKRVGRPLKNDYVLDGNSHYRSNKDIKDKFNALCKAEGTTMATVFNNYMAACVEANELLATILLDKEEIEQEA